jgi:hypothetical protein
MEIKFSKNKNIDAYPTEIIYTIIIVIISMEFKQNNVCSISLEPYFSNAWVALHEEMYHKKL